MARIDRARFDAACFPVTATIPTRIADLDVQGHVNNVAAMVILQEARARFNDAARLPPLRGDLRMMVAGLTVEFTAELHHPDPVEVATGVIAIGRTSFRLGQVARQGGRACLYSEATLVLADADGAAPIPPALRAMFERLTIADAGQEGAGG